MQLVNTWRPGCCSSLGIQEVRDLSKYNLQPEVDRKLVTDDCKEFRKLETERASGQQGHSQPGQSFHTHPSVISLSLPPITQTCNPSLKKGWTCCANSLQLGPTELCPTRLLVQSPSIKTLEQPLRTRRTGEEKQVYSTTQGWVRADNNYSQYWLRAYSSTM